MARIRSVHPGLFSDEAFVSCSMPARLLAIGLWTEADDKGVFEWKPLGLKMRIFPADDFNMPNVSAMLEELASADIVKRFEACGKTYGAIRNFRRFQRPKKPNDIHPLPSDLLKYVGLASASSVPVGNQFGTSSEKSIQMEDGGWRMEEGGGNNNLHIQEGKHLKETYTRRDQADPCLRVEDQIDGAIEENNDIDDEFAEFEGAQ